MKNTLPEKTIAFTVDEELHKEIKLRIAESGQFLKGYIINLIREDLKNAKKQMREVNKEFTIEDAIEKEDELRQILNQLCESKKK